MFEIFKKKEYNTEIWQKMDLEHDYQNCQFTEELAKNVPLTNLRNQNEYREVMEDSAY